MLRQDLWLDCGGFGFVAYNNVDSVLARLFHEGAELLPALGGVVFVVFVALGNGEQALPHQGQEVMFNFAALPGIMEAAGGVFREAVALVQLPEHQAAGIGGDLAALKIGDDFLGKKTFKPELVMADCFHRVSLLRS
jgi:hypothetical protein